MLWTSPVWLSHFGVDMVGPGPPCPAKVVDVEADGKRFSMRSATNPASRASHQNLLAVGVDAALNVLQPSLGVVLTTRGL